MQDNYVQVYDLDPGLTHQDVQHIADLDDPREKIAQNLFAQVQGQELPVRNVVVGTPYMNLEVPIDREDNTMAQAQQVQNVQNNQQAQNQAAFNQLNNMSTAELEAMLAQSQVNLQQAMQQAQQLHKQNQGDERGFLASCLENWKYIGGGVALAIGLYFLKTKFFDDDTEEVVSAFSEFF